VNHCPSNHTGTYLISKFLYGVNPLFLGLKRKNSTVDVEKGISWNSVYILMEVERRTSLEQ
jgi:hypothetical protein